MATSQLGVFLTVFLAYCAINGHGLPLAARNLDQFRTCLAAAGVDVVSTLYEYNADPSSTYTSLNYQWEQRNPTRNPAAYLVVHSSEEVQAAVRCARAQQPEIPLIPRGGGHSYEKHSYADAPTVIIDLQKLDQLTVQDSSSQFTVGAGALLAQIVWPLYSQHSLVVPHGTCPTVGIGGLALGGGYGVLSRVHGLTTDQILELEVVTADGELRVVNSTRDPGLLWALKGGGTGSFGIVTSLTMRGYTPPEQVTYGYAYYPLALFPLVFAAWQASLDALPREITTKLSVYGTQIEVEACDVQATPSGLEGVRAYLERFPYTFDTRFEELNYPDFLMKSMYASGYGVTHPSEFERLTRHSHTARPFKAKSFYGSGMATEQELETMHGVLQTVPSWPTSVIVTWLGTGGAIDDPMAAATSSFVHRGEEALYLVQAFYQGGGDTESALAWLIEFFRVSVGLEGVGAAHSYQNYADSDLDDYQQRYYGQNLVKLLEIKRRVDPTNFWRHPQSISL